MATALLVTLNYVAQRRPQDLGLASWTGFSPGPQCPSRFLGDQGKSRGVMVTRGWRVPAGVELPSDFKVPVPLSTPYVVRPLTQSIPGVGVHTAQESV